MEITERHREYWRKNLWLITILLVIWAAVTYIPSWFARDFNQATIFGWPFAFYMAAQGALIVYVIIIAVYARYMNRLDREYDVHEEEEQ